MMDQLERFLLVASGDEMAGALNSHEVQVCVPVAQERLLSRPLASTPWCYAQSLRITWTRSKTFDSRAELSRLEPLGLQSGMVNCSSLNLNLQPKTQFKQELRFRNGIATPMPVPKKVDLKIPVWGVIGPFADDLNSLCCPWCFEPVVWWSDILHLLCSGQVIEMHPASPAGAVFNTFCCSEQAWSLERTSYLGTVLQKMMRGYTEAAVSYTTGLLTFISRFALQASPRFCEFRV